MEGFAKHYTGDQLNRANQSSSTGKARIKLCLNISRADSLSSQLIIQTSPDRLS
jgi:hypothetical protein